MTALAGVAGFVSLHNLDLYYTVAAHPTSIES